MKEAKAALHQGHGRRQGRPRGSGHAARPPEKTAEARKDAAEDKRDAEYKVAVEKCDSLAGDAKDTCVRDAKAVRQDINMQGESVVSLAGAAQILYLPHRT